MHEFRDAKDRTWQLAVNVATVKAVRDALGFDLLDTAAVFQKLAADPVLLVDVLWILCAGQAAEKGVDDRRFGEAMAGDPIEAATIALMEDLIDFFPNPRDRARGKSAMTRLLAAETTLHDAMDRQMETMIERQLQSLTNSVSSLPESADANPGVIPFES